MPDTTDTQVDDRKNYQDNEAGTHNHATFLLRACSFRRLELSRARPGPRTPSEELIASSSSWRFSNSGFSVTSAAWAPKALFFYLEGKGDTRTGAKTTTAVVGTLGRRMLPYFGAGFLVAFRSSCSCVCGVARVLSLPKP